MKLDRGDYVGDITPHANFGISTPKGAVLHMREVVIVRVYFLHPRYFLIPCAPVEIAPFDGFSSFMAQKTCFRDSYVLFWGVDKNFNYFHYSSPKNAKFPIPAM